jgi:hypothetical protein
MEADDQGYASVNGLSMYNEVHGDGPPAVLMQRSGHHRRRRRAPLAASRRVIAVGLQGHGHTADADRLRSGGAFKLRV